MDEVFDPLSLKHLVLSRNLTNAVTLAELEASFVVGSIALLHSAMAMLQAIFELSNVNSSLGCIDIFTEAMPNTCFPFAGVGVLAVHALVR